MFDLYIPIELDIRVDLTCLTYLELYDLNIILFIAIFPICEGFSQITNIFIKIIDRIILYSR